MRLVLLVEGNAATWLAWLAAHRHLSFDVFCGSVSGTVFGGSACGTTA
jgi:hypothetical protein